MISVGSELLRDCFRTCIKEFPGKKANIKSAALGIVEKIIPGKGGPDEFFPFFYPEIAFIGIKHPAVTDCKGHLIQASVAFPLCDTG